MKTTTKTSSNRKIKVLVAVACAAVMPLGVTLLTTGCAGDRYHESTGEGIDDSATTVRVKEALGKDPTYKYDDVHVSTFKGTVELSGFVVSDDARSHAEQVTRGVEGVQNVENKISVRS